VGECLSIAFGMASTKGGMGQNGVHISTDVLHGLPRTLKSVGSMDTLRKSHHFHTASFVTIRVHAGGETLKISYDQNFL
jgi:hypothetical protein